MVKVKVFSCFVTSHGREALNNHTMKDNTQCLSVGFGDYCGSSCKILIQVDKKFIATPVR